LGAGLRRLADQLQCGGVRELFPISVSQSLKMLTWSVQFDLFPHNSKKEVFLLMGDV
jgi:hypothetical protein